MSEIFPSNSTLNALSGTQSADGQPYPTIGETPWYTDAFKAQLWAEGATQQSNALRVYKSGALAFGVYPGSFRKADGTIVSYGGSATAFVKFGASHLKMRDGSGSGGGTIYMDGGNIVNANSIQATSFAGDGSNLTGVTSTSSDPSKLPLSGGTMSGDVIMGGNNLWNVSHIGGDGDSTGVCIEFQGERIQFLGYHVNMNTGNGYGGGTLDMDGGEIRNTGQMDATNFPTSDPHVAGRVWNNSGVLNVSAG